MIKSLFSYMFAKNCRKRSLFEKVMAKIKRCSFLPHSVFTLFLFLCTCQHWIDQTWPVFKSLLIKCTSQLNNWVNKWISWFESKIFVFAERCNELHNSTANITVTEFWEAVVICLSSNESVLVLLQNDYRHHYVVFTKV